MQAESNTAVEANFDIKPVHDKHPEKPSLTQATSQGGQDIKAVHDPGRQYKCLTVLVRMTWFAVTNIDMWTMQAFRKGQLLSCHLRSLLKGGQG